VEDFGRRQPWAVIAGGLALGFAASRFLKASSSRRYESSSNLPSRRGTAYPTGGLTAGAPTSRTGVAPRDVTGEYPRTGSELPDVPPTPRPGAGATRPTTGALSDEPLRDR
jgi:hypothetical protein